MPPKPSINFTDKDFDSIKKALVDYAKLYYPESYKNFNDLSFGSLIFDNLAHIGDILSFQIDYQGNESFIDSAIQVDNIEILAKQLGFRDQGNGCSQGECSFFIKVPANNYNEPDRRYLPILKKDTKVLSKSGASFLLTEDINFSASDVEFITLEVDNNGLPTYFAVKKIGTIISGEKYIQSREVTTFDTFLKIKILNPNFIEVISVTDSSGNEYYKVDYLSQNIIYKQIINNNLETNRFSKYKLQRYYVSRKFVIEKIEDYYYLVFGKGDIDAVVEPSNIVLDFYGRNYSSDEFFDPSKILQTDKFGIAPTNTTLTIKYRANNTPNVNVNTDGLQSVMNPTLYFESSGLSQSIMNMIESSIEVTNDEPLLGFVSDSTIDELKQRSKDSYACQGRAVTQSDYASLVYSMDGRNGSVKKCNIVKDRRSIRNNLNLYVLSETTVNNNKILIQTNNIIKENLKNWLESRKIISDTIDILDAKIVNLKVSYKVHGQPLEDKNDIEAACFRALKSKFSTKMEIGESFDISSIYRTLNLLPQVVDTKDVKIEVLNGIDYTYNNFDINKYLSSDETYIECPDDVCFEIKYPTRDIKATILKLN